MGQCLEEDNMQGSVTQKEAHHLWRGGEIG